MNEEYANSEYPQDNRLVIQHDKKGEGEGDEPMSQLLPDGSMSDTEKFLFQMGSIMK